MTAILDELGLTRLVTSMTGLSAIGAAAILAETGDPRRFATRPGGGQARRPGPAGEAVRRVHRPDPADRAGDARATAGRPGARSGEPNAPNPVYRARYQHLTSRQQNKLTPTQAQTIIAAAILRHLHAVITTGQAWGPGHRRPTAPITTARRSPPESTGGPSSWRPGRALRGIETPAVISALIMGSPARRLLNPIRRCAGPTPDRPLCRDRRPDEAHPAKTDAKPSHADGADVLSRPWAQACMPALMTRGLVGSVGAGNR
jgi:hypothetical protein